MGGARDLPAPTLAWVRRRLGPGAQVVDVERLHGGITADVRRLTVAGPDGGVRSLVLRSFADPAAAPLLRREAEALAMLAGTDVPAPGLVAVDAEAAECAQPSLLMTHLPGRVRIDDAGAGERLPLLAGQLAAVHALRPAERPPEYEALTTAESVVVPPGADGAVWDWATGLLRGPVPAYEGRYLHRDFHPGNVLFDEGGEGAAGPAITGIVDWAAPSWGPVDLDVAHCAANLALLHGPEWGLRFVRAYEAAGGVRSARAADRRFWLVRGALAFSEQLAEVSEPWRGAGRGELTPAAVGQRLDAYLGVLRREPG